MRRLLVLPVLLLLFVFVSGCSNERPLAPSPAGSPTNPAITVDPEAVAVELVSRAGWAVTTEGELPAKVKELQAAGATGHILTAERQVIVDDIVHYSFQVRVGPGQYDVIGLHRVVRENGPCKPIRTGRSVFLQHGDYVSFVTAFLPSSCSPSTPAGFGFAVQLAEGDVDVWGIDQAWSLIPEGVTDFSFMADWGLQKEVDRLSAGIGVARVARLLSGNGLDKMLLLGYSSGAFTGYALLNQETQLPPGRRQVKGYISVDSEMKTDWQELIAADQAYLEYLQFLYAGGQYQEDIIWRSMATLARTQPDAESPFFPPLTNWQAALAMAAAPYATTSAHYLAGLWEGELPVGFRFTPVDRWLDFLGCGAAYEPLLFRIDFYSVECGVGDPPFDDHLSEISIPILAVGAGGGFMPSAFMDELVASNDFTELVIRLESPEQAVVDFGHVDLFTADNAPTLVWTPILSWIIAHTDHGHGGHDVTMH